MAALNQLVPVEANKPYDMYDVIKKIFDQGDFFEISPHFATNIITGFARLGGRSVAVVANQPKRTCRLP
jgi:acetyl-CoA carboxylase carboxyltransferase component